MCARVVVAAAYSVVMLGASGSQLALIILSLLVVGGLSAPLVSFACRQAAQRLGDVRSGHAPLVLGMAYTVIVTLCAPAALKGPDDLWLAYVFGAFWGVGFSFFYSLLRPVFFFIVPGGAEAKYSGMFSFCQVKLVCNSSHCAFKVKCVINYSHIRPPGIHCTSFERPRP